MEGGSLQKPLQARPSGLDWPHEHSGTVLPKRLGLAPELSPDARRRLRWMDYYDQHGHNVAQTCRYFDISRETFYRGWNASAAW